MDWAQHVPSFCFLHFLHNVSIIDFYEKGGGGGFLFRIAIMQGLSLIYDNMGQSSKLYTSSAKWLYDNIKDKGVAVILTKIIHLF